MSTPVESAALADVRPADVGTVSAAMEVLEGRSKRAWFLRLLRFLGPAFIASVNIQAGAKYGYMLLWVILASNLMAMLVQTLAAKLGIATGKNLAEMMRDHYPRWGGLAMWLMMEGVAMATDLAEFLGAALGVYLLLPGPFNALAQATGLPELLVPAVVMGLLTLVVLLLEHGLFRPLQFLITGLVGIIAVCYLIETVLDRPDWGLLAYNAVVPHFAGTESILLATGILGATVMPHAIFLHSGLMQGCIVTREPKLLRRIFRFEVMDVLIAMSIAGLVNMAMLVMAASTFFQNGLSNIGTIEEAHRTLVPLLGGAASFVFVLSLLASGHSSSTVGTMAGQIIMQGFTRRRIPMLLRRLMTMLPSLS